MILPEGSVIGTFSGTLQDILPFVSPLVGVLHVISASGEGFLLVDKGKFTASLFQGNSLEMKGNAAYDLIIVGQSLGFEMRRYSPEEYSEARDICAKESLLIAYDDSGKPLQTKTGRHWNLEKIKKQPGVLAVSAFHEGFAVQSSGNADFEQVAAVAEDLLRAGKKIAGDLAIDPLNQLILETPHGKFIIAPYGDINICIFTEADANLGLIRMAIRNIQSEVD
ncbi:MAG: roadblock/LC7 domain-containing protein [Methanomicrobiales archaeon]|nr:roadblock/LC7 domain-containing protein [Methanomicrobiales archaeon]